MLTRIFYHHTLVKLGYYKFGQGAKTMLCFHGLGMHGKQFQHLESELGGEYTFYGFDLFFHQETELLNNDLRNIKQGLPPQMLIYLINDFCEANAIHSFSLLAYSMGTIYSNVILNFLPEKVNEVFAIAPIFLKVNPMIRFFAINPLGNKIFEKIALSNSGLFRTLQFARQLHLLGNKEIEILWREIETPKLRLNLYSIFTYLRFFDVNINMLAQKANSYAIPLYLIFGEKDKNIDFKYAKNVEKRFQTAKTYVFPNQGHDLVNSSLTRKTLFCTND